jgi:dTDP-4-dehydrorhamnose 3,5-epimerase
VLDLLIPDLKLFEPRIFSDDRGAFFETYNEREMSPLGLPTKWVQDNYSLSKRNVIRGIHYQITHPQGKLVRVTLGQVLDVAVDLRKSSPTFGKYAAVELSDSNYRMFWIPPGFGHAFVALSEQVGFAYKTSDFYDPQGERTIQFDDPEIAIKWPIKLADAIVSEKDRAGSLLKDAEVFA